MNETEPIGDITLLQIANLGTIKFLSFSLNKKGDLIELHGPNDSGKSTALNALQFAFQGATKIPKDIIRHGVYTDGDKIGEPIDRAKVRVETSSEWVIERTIRKNKKGDQISELSVTRKGLAPAGGAQTFLDEISSRYSNPQLVADLPSKELFQTLATLARIDTATIDSKISSLKDDQKIIRKQIKNAGVLVKPVDPKPKMKDVSVLVNTYDEIKQWITDDNYAKEQLQANIKAEEVEKTVVNTIIEDMKRELQEASINLDEIIIRIKTLKKQQKYAVETDPLYTETEIAEMKNEIEGASTIQTLVSQWDIYENDKEALTSLDKEMEVLSQKLTAKELEKTAAFVEAELPMKGLRITEEGDVFFEKDLWENVSESSKLLIATRLCVNSIPDAGLKYIYIHRGESIGTEKRKQIAKIAKEKDIKILMEVMDESGPELSDNKIYIREGEIVLAGEVVDITNKMKADNKKEMSSFEARGKSTDKLLDDYQAPSAPLKKDELF